MNLTEWIAARRAELEASTGGTWRVHTDRRFWATSDVVGTDWTANRDNDAQSVVSAHNTYGAMLDVIEAAVAVSTMHPAEPLADQADKYQALDVALAELAETKP